jgi:DNA invertase Pin-like site-specific DNA recombinase
MNPQPLNSQPRVVGYIRGSTEEQQNTLEAQRQQIEAYCTYKQLDLAACFVDEGESAYSVSFYERPKAAEMVSRMAEFGATGIIITKLDRGFRNALDCLFTIDQLKKQGIGLHLLDIQLDPNSPVGKLLITMMAAIAEFENERRSERQKQCFAVIKAQGKRCGGIPYGWVRAGLADKDAPLLPDEEEQRVLREIVRLTEKEKMGPSTIAGILNKAGTPTKNGGKKWFPATVESVYKHRRLAAEPDNSGTQENREAA